MNYLSICIKLHVFALIKLQKLLFIGKAYRKAKIEKNPNITYYDVGSSVNLTCEAEKNTNLYEIIWYKSDSQRNMITLKSALNGPGILTLTLNPLSKENAGSYTCVISRPQVNYYSSRVVKITLKGKISKLIASSSTSTARLYPFDQTDCR